MKSVRQPQPDGTQSVILGFDPGTVVTGFSVISAHPPARLLESGVVRPTRGQPIEKRLETIYSYAIELLKRYNPVAVAVEDPFVGKNPHSALVLGQARGVLLLAAATQKVEVAHYSPRAVKSSIVGRGSATKEQVQFMVQKLLNLPHLPEPLDASDAIAVALCHLHRMKLQTKPEGGAVDPARLARNPGDVDAIARWKAGKGNRR